MYNIHHRTMETREHADCIGTLCAHFYSLFCANFNAETKDTTAINEVLLLFNIKIKMHLIKVIVYDEIEKRRSTRVVVFLHDRVGAIQKFL